MATSNIAGRAQRDAIARTPFGSSFSRTALDKPQDSSYGDLQYRRSWATRCDRQNSLWVSILVHSSWEATGFILWRPPISPVVCNAMRSPEFPLGLHSRAQLLTSHRVHSIVATTWDKPEVAESARAYCRALATFGIGL